MKIFDEDGKYLGEFIENTKEKAEDAFAESWIWGIVFLLIIAPGWALIALAFWALLKLIKIVGVLVFNFFVLLLRCLWWVIRLPFYLVFRHETPMFW